jgi:hypothetical protein
MRVDLDPKELAAFHSVAQLNADLSYRKKRMTHEGDFAPHHCIEVDRKGQLISQ